MMVFGRVTFWYRKGMYLVLATNSTAANTVFLSLCVSAATERHTAGSWRWFCKKGLYASKTFTQMFKPCLKSEVDLSQSSLLDCRYLAAF